jgi:hypothetical protein
MTRQFQTTQPQPSLRSLPADRRGRLRNGARPGDFLAAPRCGARARHGGSCQQPAMKSPRGGSGRCRFHGGKSTGPRTAEGRLRCRQAKLQHGGYAAEVKALQRAASIQIKRVGALLAMMAGRATPEQAVLCREIAREAAALQGRATAGHGVLCSESDFPSPSPRPARPAGAISVPVGVIDPHAPLAVVSTQVAPAATAGHGVLCSESDFSSPDPYPRGDHGAPALRGQHPCV